MADNVTTQIVQEAPEVQAFKMGLLGSAKNTVDAINASALQGNFMQPNYKVAGLSQNQLDAIGLGQAGIGAYQPYLAAGTQGVTQGALTTKAGLDTMLGADTRDQFGGARRLNELYGQANLTPATGALGSAEMALRNAAQAFNPADVSQYMNPYQQQVIDESLRQINRQGDIARQNLQAQATAAGAFGGSREGIQRAELERGLAGQRNAAILGGLSQGYQNSMQQAQQAFEAQQQRKLAQAQGFGSIGSTYGQQGLQQAQLGQGAAGLAGSLASQQFGIGQQLAQGIGSLGAQQAALGMNAAQLGQGAQTMGQQDVNFLYNLGAQQQRQQQAVLDAARQNQLQQNMQPLQMLGFLSDIYKGAPSSQMATSMQSQAAPSPFQQIAGLGIGATSAAAAASKAGLF